MQFTRLKLNGFKSFVDPTDLVISTGLTGVVGPNGCGKSNLLEALRWIMGENRPTQMRGEGMDDVIFAGTDSRPTRSSASVELVVDNSDRLAPAQFNVEDRIEISRRITREVGSAYKINGKDVRARDVQMLFADASTGSHSPALVRQGQISELINAKPKARRRILEEAAGISGLYQRRHEAELKLRGAETNLTRVDDVLDQLGQRLSSLERQAGQARRYRRIAEELRRTEAVLLYLRWRVAEDERADVDAKLTEATKSVAEAEASNRTASKSREAAEEAMPPLREEETVAAAVLQRLTIERDQLDEHEERARAEVEALTARLRQLAMDGEREQTLGKDAEGTISALTQEIAELEAAQRGYEDQLKDAAEAARQSGDVLSEQETQLDRLTEEAARLAARATAGERRLEEARANLSRLEDGIAEAEQAITQADQALADAEGQLSTHAAAEQAARTGAGEAETALSNAETARASAQETESEARAAMADAEGECSALQAEVQGLERLLQRDAGDGTALVDRIEVTTGYEAALGAALGDDLSADEVSDGTGWFGLTPYGAAAALPDGATPLGQFVKAPPVLDRRLSQTGVVDQAMGDALQDALQPGQRLVSAEGDLWRWDGFRLRSGGASSAAALRLQQRNRLARLQAQLEKAESLRARAAEAHGAARQGLDLAGANEAAARTARREADQALSDAARAVNRIEGEIALLRSRAASHSDALEARRVEHREAEAARTEAEEALAELGDVDEARRAVEIQRGEVDLARTAMLSARSTADDVRRAGSQREKRLADAGREAAIWEDRRSNAGARIAEIAARVTETEQRKSEVSALPEELSSRRDALAREIDAAEIRRRSAADALAEGETAQRKAETDERAAGQTASSRREERARLDAILEALQERTTEAANEIRTEMEVEPEALLETLEADPVDLPPLENVEGEVLKLRRQRDALGAVNLRAEEDANEIREEREGIETEKADLDQAIAKLRKGITELNREGRERLLAAFENVNKRFANLFRHLFGGGEARLIMVESDDPLDAGLEILCQPPGKKLSTLSLLSGGEQTLTALSLIFAVFLSNPAPICVLDEVDAPLDDSNVTRFCDLLDEMRRLTETRFLIITHHAITMSRMDRLFGVTMVERGVSQLVSVDLARASEMVDA